MLRPTLLGVVFFNGSPISKLSILVLYKGCLYVVPTYNGVCLKGIQPILPLFREAVLNGTPEEKEQAAQGIGEVIKLASPEALQPSVVHITGPLIRILGDRFAFYYSYNC